MMKKVFKIKSQVWIYSGVSAWHFVSITKKQSKEIDKNFGSKKRGWGSLPVLVTLGKTSWVTSIFPDKKSNMYLLPLKASVRKKEEILNGDTINFSMTIEV
jgi:hypothetical protein